MGTGEDHNVYGNVMGIDYHRCEVPNGLDLLVKDENIVRGIRKIQRIQAAYREVHREVDLPHENRQWNGIPRTLCKSTYAVGNQTSNHERLYICDEWPCREIKSDVA